MKTLLPRQSRLAFSGATGMAACLVFAQPPPPGPPPFSAPPPNVGGPGPGPAPFLARVSRPLEGLTSRQLADVQDGLDDFRQRETPATGLGPIFNDVSCLACHDAGGAGGASRRTVTRFGCTVNGVFDPLDALGGSRLQERSIDPAVREVVPPQANTVARRLTTPLFGVGLVAAIPDATIVANTLLRKPAGIRGKVSVVADVDRVAEIMRLLAPPTRGADTVSSRAGERLFASLDCAACHTPAMTTGKNSLAALSEKSVALYSDLLLHDMGSLGDGIAQGAASTAEMRTAPLWGWRARPVWLHDGRATTIDEAIRGHDGEARNSRDRYNALNATARQQLLDFLNTP